MFIFTLGDLDAPSQLMCRPSTAKLGSAPGVSGEDGGTRGGRFPRNIHSGLVLELVSLLRVVPSCVTSQCV